MKVIRVFVLSKCHSIGGVCKSGAVYSPPTASVGRLQGMVT